MYYLEDISAGKLLVLEHGRREGVDGGPEIVVEKEDTKDTVRTQSYLRWDNIFLWCRYMARRKAPKTLDSMLPCQSTSEAC